MAEREPVSQCYFCTQCNIYETRQSISLGPLQHLVDGIIEQGPPYYSAIQISVQNAYQSYLFAGGAEEFFEALQDITPDTKQLFETGIQDLIEVAKVGQDSAVLMNTGFRDVRIRLLEVSFIHFVN